MNQIEEVLSSIENLDISDAEATTAAVFALVDVLVDKGLISYEAYKLKILSNMTAEGDFKCL
jgi:hypothetical protein